MIASVLLVAVISTACINNMAVQELNNKAADYKFNSITYDADKNIGTFDMASLTEPLANYAESGIVDMFQTIMKDATKIQEINGGL